MKKIIRDESTKIVFACLFLATGHNMASIAIKNFTAKKVCGNALIEWVAASVESEAYYILEKSSDGFTFQTIDSAAFQQNDGVESNYTYTDKDYSGSLVYYRLGYVRSYSFPEYYKIISLQAGSIPSEKNFETGPLYPNPSSEQCSISINSSKEQKIILTILSKAGKPVANCTMYCENGNNYFLIPEITSLLPGMYYFIFTEPGGEQIVQRFIKE